MEEVEAGWVCGSEHSSALLGRENTGAIKETGAFISLSSVHLASITGLLLYTDSFWCLHGS